MRVFAPHRSGIRCSAWMLHGVLLAALAVFVAVRVCSAEPPEGGSASNVRAPGGKRELDPNPLGGKRRFPRISSVEIHPDGDLVLWGSASGALRLWDLKTGAARLEADLEEASWGAARFSPNGEFIAAVSCAPGYSHDDGIGLYLWETRTGRRLAFWPIDKLGCTEVRFSPDGRVIATAGHRENYRLTHEVRFWDIETGKVKATATRKQSDVEYHGICSAIWLSDNRHVATATKYYYKLDQRILMTRRIFQQQPVDVYCDLSVIDSATGNVTTVKPVPFTILLPQQGNWFFDEPASMPWQLGGVMSLHPGENCFALGNHAGEVHVFRAPNLQNDATLNLPVRAPRVKYLSSGTRPAAFVAAAPDTCFTWSEARQIEKHKIDALASSISALALSADGSLLGLGHSDGTVRIWDLKGGRLRAVLDSPMKD